MRLSDGFVVFIKISIYLYYLRIIVFNGKIFHIRVVSHSWISWGNYKFEYCHLFFGASLVTWAWKKFTVSNMWNFFCLSYHRIVSIFILLFTLLIRSGAFAAEIFLESTMALKRIFTWHERNSFVTTNPDIYICLNKSKQTRRKQQHYSSHVTPSF